MNQKSIGAILIIVGLLLASFVFITKNKEDAYIEELSQEHGTCFRDDGSCLHADRDYSYLIFGAGLSLALIALGAYLVFFDKTQEVLARHQVQVSSALKEARKDEKFDSFLAGFTPEEQELLKIIKNQDGIKQATLRIKAGMSKTSVSLILSSLEERGVIARKPVGKTNEVYLKKPF